ncbi:hypothetical protein [Bacillus sp. B19-2]|uniref:hypothetical protein n=1 Tax=Bacillus sp. B19-2 TaxID=2929516 RepID=UPI001FBB3FEC|nr:hypothetical protein [Bacillus sp. B19-2]MCJ2147676.1 hypothetical protein [Bacillus sp. B19-2]
MADTNFDRFTEDSKVIFFLGLSEKVSSVFSRKEDQIFAKGSSRKMLGVDKR